MPFGTIYQTLINQIITDLKTLTPQLADDTASLGGPRVTKWKSSKSPRVGRYEVEVKAGPMEFIDGMTTKSTNNEFNIILDLLFYSAEFEAGFDGAMSVAERIYDLFHLKNISSIVRNCTVSIFPGDGDLAGRNLLAIPIRIIIKCDKVITQT